MSPITRGPSTATDAGSAAATTGSAEGRSTPVGGSVETPAGDGRSTRWDDHREARRAELVQVARRVVHHQGPDVSMDDIAAAAGTSKSIVYRYFTDKQGLQLAVAEAVVADIRAALADAAGTASTPRDALRKMVTTYLAMIDSSPRVYTFVTRDGSVGHVVDTITALLADPFLREVAAPERPDQELPGPGRPGPGPEAWAQVWAAGAVGFVRGAGERWLADRTGPSDPEQADAERDAVAAQVTAWLWAGPVGMLSRERRAVPQTLFRPGVGPPAVRDDVRAPRTDLDPSRVDDDAPTPREHR